MDNELDSAGNVRGVDSQTPAAASNPAAALDDAELDRLLREDVPYHDLTTDGLDIGATAGQLQFAARGPMVACGLEEAARLFERRGCRCDGVVARGQSVAAGALLLCASGPAGALHEVWKTAQTLVEAVSGMATATAQIVLAVRGVGKQPAVVTTRKNFPGTRALASLATRAGGATAHRLGLSETLLVFPEHRLFFAPEELPGRMASLKRRHPEKKLVVEVLDAADAMAMARAGADVLQLEKLSPDEVARTVRRLQESLLAPLVAVAGGVNARNAADYARAGADILVTSAPYWAPPSDVRVTFLR
jgi:molybdenum transport protein